MDNVPSSSNDNCIKKRRNRNPLWKYFHVHGYIKNIPGKSIKTNFRMAKCRLCGQELQGQRRTMANHLTLYCAEATVNVREEVVILQTKPVVRSSANESKVNDEFKKLNDVEDPSVPTGRDPVDSDHRIGLSEEAIELLRSNGATKECISEELRIAQVEKEIERVKKKAERDIEDCKNKAKKEIEELSIMVFAHEPTKETEKNPAASSSRDFQQAPFLYNEMQNNPDLYAIFPPLDDNFRL